MLLWQGKKHLQKESWRLPASCNASLVHCLRTNVSKMFWANQLLYSRAIWCRKRQSWRSRVRLNAASGSVREWFIWNYCCAVLLRVGYWCVRLKWLLQEGGIGGFSGDTHTHISLLSSAKLRHLPLHCYPACHFFHVCCTQGVLGCSDIGS